MQQNNELPNLTEAYTTHNIEQLNKLAELNGQKSIEFEYTTGTETHKMAIRACKATLGGLDTILFGIWESPKDGAVAKPIARAVYYSPDGKAARLSSSSKAFINEIARATNNMIFMDLNDLDTGDIGDVGEDAAFAISLDFRANNPKNDLGQLFFAITLDVLEKNNYDKLKISTDITRKKPRFQYRSLPTPNNEFLQHDPSFYSKYTQVLEQDVLPSKKPIKTAQDRHPRIRSITVSTRVTPPQYHMLKECLG